MRGEDAADFRLVDRQAALAGEIERHQRQVLAVAGNAAGFADEAVLEECGGAALQHLECNRHPGTHQLGAFFDAGGHRANRHTLGARAFIRLGADAPEIVHERGFRAGSEGVGQGGGAGVVGGVHLEPAVDERLRQVRAAVR